MEALARHVTPESRWLFMRRVFQTWSIGIPGTFDERFIKEDSYWHAWDDQRSISLTSMTIDKSGRPVSATEILEAMKPDAMLGKDGIPVEELPAGLNGHARYGPIEQPARASSALCGLLAIDGRVLIVTITSDDFDWARDVWLSIHAHPIPPGPGRRRQRSSGRRRRSSEPSQASPQEGPKRLSR